MGTDKQGIPQQEMEDKKDGRVKIVGDEVKSRKHDEIKMAEGLKEESEVPKEMVEVVWKGEINYGDEEEVTNKNEDCSSISAKKKDKDDEIVAVEEGEGEKNLEDCVNLTEMPSEGHQEVRKESEEKEKLKDKDSSCSKELQFKNFDEDFVGARKCIANNVSSEINRDPAVTPAVIMETEKVENDDMSIPVETTINDEEATYPPYSSVPASEIVVQTREIVVSTRKSEVSAPDTILKPSVPSELIEVDPEITLLKKEADLLRAALIWERGSKAELSSQLKKSHAEIALKTKNLNVAENQLWERSTAVASLAERDIQLKALQESFDKLNEENGKLQRKYGNLQNSLVDIGKQFEGIYETLQNHFKICNATGPDMVPLTPHEALQRRVDDLTTSVLERYKFWNTEQHKLSEELGATTKMMEEMIEFLEVAEEKTKPPPEAADLAISHKEELTCNLCRNSFSNVGILQIHRKSCGDAVAGASHSSNPNKPAPTVKETDLDDIAIIGDESFNAPVSPQSRINDYSLESPPTTDTNNTIPQLSSYPAVAMCKIALSFANTYAIKHTKAIRKHHLGYFCSCGVEFRTEKQLDGHLLFQDGKLSEKPPSKKMAKVKEEFSTPSSPRLPSSLHKTKDEEEEPKNKTKKRRISVTSEASDEPETEQEKKETSLRSSKRLKKIKERASAKTGASKPVSFPRTKKQTGGGGSRNQKN